MKPSELESFFMSAIFQLPYLSTRIGPVKLSHDINLRSCLHMRKLAFQVKWLLVITNKKCNYCFIFQENISFVDKCSCFFFQMTILLVHSNRLTMEIKKVITHLIFTRLSSYKMEPVVFGTNVIKE